MGLKAVLENLDDLDPSLHDHYKKDDKSGKYVLDLEDTESLPRVSQLKNENAQWRIKHKDVSTKLQTFSALGDLTEVQAKLDRIPELEAAAEGKLDETKINGLVEARLKTKLAPIERERDQYKTKVTELEGTVQEYTAKERQRMIGDSVRTAIGRSQGFNSHAVEDAIVFAERHLHVDEDGSVVTKEGVGVTPGVDAVVWLQEMQSKKPHWWGTTQGGGAQGNGKGGGAGGVNPFTHENWSLTEQGKLIKENRARAEQMAKAAGTTIGGGRPAPRAK